MAYHDFLHDFEETIRTATARLQEISADNSGKSANGEWSAKQIVGHLIDSAANNHQRFVRAQQSDPLVMPGYEQNHWVSSQGYQEADWSHLVTLWMHLNLHLVDVIGHLPPDKYSVACVIGDSQPLTLEALVIDYLRHLQHHIAQIRPTLA